MAKRVTTKTVEEKEIPDEITPDPSLISPLSPQEWIPAQSDEEAGLQNFLDSLGEGDIAFKIYKFDSTTNRPRFMADVGLDGANESFCQANWGEGRYQIKAFKEGKHQGSRTIYCGAPLRKETPAAQPFVIQPPAGMDPALQIQLEMIRQESQNNREMMKLLIESMNKGDGKSSSMELAEIMVMLKGMIPPPAAGANILETITQAIPLVKELIGLGASGAATGEKTWSDTIKDMLPEVGGILKNVMASRTAQPAPSPQVPIMPSYPDTVKPLAAAPAVGGISPEQLEQLRYYFGFLKTRAKKNGNPDVFIDLVMETLDDQQSLAICSLLDRSYEEIAAAIDPEIMEPIVYRPWFESFFGGLRDAIIERNAPGGTGGDEVEPAKDAGSGTGGDKVRS